MAWRSSAQSLLRGLQNHRTVSERDHAPEDPRPRQRGGAVRRDRHLATAAAPRRNQRGPILERSSLLSLSTSRLTWLLMKHFVHIQGQEIPCFFLFHSQKSSNFEVIPCQILKRNNYNGLFLL